MTTALNAVSYAKTVLHPYTSGIKATGNSVWETLSWTSKIIAMTSAHQARG